MLQLTPGSPRHPAFLAPVPVASPFALTVSEQKPLQIKSTNASVAINTTQKSMIKVCVSTPNRRSPYVASFSIPDSHAIVVFFAARTKTHNMRNSLSIIVINPVVSGIDAAFRNATTRACSRISSSSTHLHVRSAVATCA